MITRRSTWHAVRLFALLLVVLLLFLVFRRIGFLNILRAISHIPPLPITSAVLLFLTVFLLWCLRWLHFLRPAAGMNMLTVFPVYMAGVFVNIITPGARVGGEPVRAYYMSRIFGGEKSRYLGTVLADKLAYATVFLGFLILSVFFVVIFVPLAMPYKVVLAGIVLLIVVAVVSGVLLRHQIGVRSGLLGKLLPVLYEGRLMKFIRRRFPTYEHFEEYAIGKLDNLVNPAIRAAGSPRALALVFTLSVVSWLLVCLAHHVLFAALGADISFPRVLVIVTISTFFGDISMSPGGAGFMEAAMLGLCAAFGLDSRTAAAVTVLSRGLFYLCGLGLGGVCLAALSAIFGRRD
ncbi:MAG: flippase-like domain-containing protein [Candidatus Brocadiia bacterium]